MAKLTLLGALLLYMTYTTNAATLWVPATPQAPQPYALKKGLGIPLPGGNTFPVTGNSSGGAFCILNTHAAGSGSGGIFPHVHKNTYETFYTVKGRVQLWGQNLDHFLANTSVQQTRILHAGDIGAIPRSTIHTFRLLEPDTQLTGVLVPGGFEEFFFHMDHLAPAPGTLPGAGGFDVTGLAAWDVYPQLDFVPRRDIVNGKAGPGNWYDGPNPLPRGVEGPVWVAKDYGSKFLVEGDGRYQISVPGGRKAPRLISAVATAFMVEEGQLEVVVEGYDAASLIDGDVVFVPGNVSFSYAATAEFTKLMYVTGGGQGMDQVLMEKGRAWDSAFYPTREAGPVKGTVRV
ncbi:RmlC-like cupin domain-containing protein [Schizothecium vesticola]|uniref:RmlC-like cupin domain-containing protein n=1 Tax=Schizothecium vesticola TaxID=314040 RepID=A0AA40K7N4_9PEZI|nr:RmlC-like cupin domain-containing protein [Schizothecium vesticola]